MWPENCDRRGPSSLAELCSSTHGRERQDQFLDVCGLSG